MTEYSFSKNESKETLYSMTFFYPHKQLGSMIANGGLDYSRGSCGEEDTKKDTEE